MFLTALFVVTGLVGTVVLAIEIGEVLRRRRRKQRDRHGTGDGPRD